MNMEYHSIPAERLREAAFQSLLWPPFREMIGRHFHPEKLQAWGAFLEGEVVGLCVIDQGLQESGAILRTLEGKDAQVLRELYALADRYLCSVPVKLAEMDFRRDPP